MTRPFHYLVGIAWALTLLLSQATGLAPTLRAQEPGDLTRSDSDIVRILEQVGGSGYDPDEVIEYIDQQSQQPAASILERHADPETTWMGALRSIQRGGGTTGGTGANSDSSVKYSIRSRVSSEVNAHEQSGFQHGDYLGPPDDLYNRLRLRSNVVNLTVLQHKKAWEPQFLDRLNGFAELAKPIPIGGLLAIERFIAGDYALAFGNGLLFGGGAGASRTFAPAEAAEQRAFGLRGTLSDDPNRALRGAAAQLAVGPAGSPTIHVLMFSSNRQLDARVVGDTIQTLYSSTYHRTTSELAVKNAASLRVNGMRASIASLDTGAHYFAAGVTAFDSRYDQPYDGTPSAPFWGRVLDAAGADLLAVGKTWSAHLEAAVTENDTNRSFLAAASVLFEPSANAAVSLLYHHIPYGAVSPFGEISGESTLTLSNANGFYAGLEVAVVPKFLRMTAYADVASVLLPASDVFGRIKRDYQYAALFQLPACGLNGSLVLRSSAGEAIGPMGSSMVSSILIDTSVSRLATIASNGTSIRADVAYIASSTLTLNGRCELRKAASSASLPESGWLARAGAVLRIGNPSSAHAGSAHAGSAHAWFTLDLSVARFSTDSYASAVYLYESGTTGSGSLILLDGHGSRASLRSTLRIARWLTTSVAAGGTLYDTSRTLGSGLTQRVGRITGDVTLQLDLIL